MSAWTAIAKRWCGASVAALTVTVTGCTAEFPEESGLLARDEGAAFKGHSGLRAGKPFDVVASDMDLDGDADLLINWHHLGPLELFENRNGLFELSNPAGGDRSGLFDNPGIPSLFAPATEITSRIDRSDSAGLYVWHDLDRAGSWRFLWKDDARLYGGFELDLRTSLGANHVEGLEEQEFKRLGHHRLDISVATGSAGIRRFSVRTLPIGVRLELRLRDPSGRAVPIFAGSHLTPSPSGHLTVWKPDPHGIAWVDVEADERPEIFITRGGLMGRLRPPLDPKVDRYYRAGLEEGSLYRLADPDLVPPSYGRGRRVEWVDIDNRGGLELSIGNKQSPNALLMREEGSPAFRNVSASHGLDLKGAGVYTWGDFDGDGFDDLYYLEGCFLRVAVRRNGRFEQLTEEATGLVLNTPDCEGKRLFDGAQIRLADFDNDGRLDLWILGYGSRRSSHLFHREGDRFRDFTRRVGLESLQGDHLYVLLDVDNDAFEDVVSFRTKRAPYLLRAVRFALGMVGWDVLRPSEHEAVLWRNCAGERFRFSRLPSTLVPEKIHAATGLDADSDGRWDLVLVGQERHLIRNISDTPNGFIDVEIRDGRHPIGALVKVLYGDGTIAVRRLGSATNSPFSQVAGPLHFGVPAALPLDGIAIRWPGDLEDTLYPAPRLNGTVRIDRRPPGRTSRVRRPGPRSEREPKASFPR